MGKRDLILLTGATGYVGGRLLERLEHRGYRLRCLARRPEFLESRVGPGTQVVKGDCLEGASLAAALKDVHTAYYLVHSMGSTGSFEDKDRLAAANFARAAADAGTQRIIYLGGLGDSAQELSPHLRSRQEVGQLLRETGVAVVEFRASIIIGSGSLSYEMIRALVERLPIMICPAWVNTQAQPIGIEDLIDYLVAALDVPPVETDFTFEIGGPEQVSYGDIMREYARQRGLRRWMIPVPVLTPRLSSLWLGLVTPIYTRIGRKLIDSLRNQTLVRDSSALERFPVKPHGVREAIRRALINEDREYAATRWSDALSSAEPRTWGGVRFGSRLVDSRTVTVKVPPAKAFEPIRCIGGDRGWYYGDWLWRLRGFLDLLVGGVGMRRGRRDPEHLMIGDTLDFWRVEKVEQNRSLRLIAEMKLPGRAWLEFEVVPGRENQIRQTAVFDPLGLWGLAYWYALYPLHHLIFAGMLRQIARRAGRTERKRRTAPSS